jgi:hypothetical protein
MQRSLVQTYMSIGAIFGLILAGPRWFAILFDRPVPHTAPAIQELLISLLIATVHGVARAFAWLPSLVYNVAMHKVPFMVWLFDGWW